MLKFLDFDCLENSLFSLFISGAITDATIKIDEDDKNQVRDRNYLLVVLDGVTTGAPYTSITWTRDGTAITTVISVPGVPYSEIFIGGNGTLHGGSPCSDRRYRPAILLGGYLPGVYQYTVDNADTPGVIQSPTLAISGMSSTIIFVHISFIITRARKRAG